MANTRDVMGESACLDALVANTLTGFEDNDVTKVGSGALRFHSALTDVTLPNATIIGGYGLADCASLREVEAQSVTSLGTYAFSNDVSLERVDLGNVSYVSNRAFEGCTHLSELEIGKPTLIGTYAFHDCKSLTTETLDMSSVTNVGNYAFDNTGVGELDLPLCTSLGTYTGRGTRTSVVKLGKSISISSDKFNGANSLCHLVLSGVTNVVSLTATAFSRTPLASGLGWIYVPDSLVDSYKGDSSWSARASQIVGTSEYPKVMQDETISDSWSTIVASSTYATDYALGSVKYLNVGGTLLAMVLVATDSDDLASGGKARMTWISRDIFETSRMNPTNSAAGGWASCEMRSWLRNVIYPQIDPTVRSAIKEVTKTYVDSDYSTQSTVDTVWIPSAREVFGGAYESSGCDYTSVFSSDSDKVKKLGIAGSASIWWLRSAHSAAYFRHVDNYGSLGYNRVYNAMGVVLGFSI